MHDEIKPKIVDMDVHDINRAFKVAISMLSTEATSDEDHAVLAQQTIKGLEKARAAIAASEAENREHLEQIGMRDDDLATLRAENERLLGHCEKRESDFKDVLREIEKQTYGDTKMRQFMKMTRRAEAAESRVEELEAVVVGGIELIAKERARQREKWTRKHDNEHSHGELAMAAAELAVYWTDATVHNPHFDGPQWGLTEKHKGDRVRQLVIAGALIAAELDRALLASHDKEPK